jgi:hypothetical protein
MKLKLPIPLFCLLVYGSTLSAQSPITAFSASYKSSTSPLSLYNALSVNVGTFSGCSASLFLYTFSNGTSNQYQLSSFHANGNTYLVAPASASVVKLRRVNNAQVTGNRNIVYMETTASSANACPLLAVLNFKPPYMDVMEDLLAGGMLNQGTDNVFTNASNGDGNNNNIERVDVIFPTGLNTMSPTQAGFAIFDRGPNFGHDAFKIAAITSLDAAGNPAGFGPVRTCTAGNGSNNNGSWGHPSTANGNSLLAVYVMRKDAAEPVLRVSSNINQEMGGVFYTFADLGIVKNKPLYGYALLGPDGIAAPTSAQLLNLADATVYPTTTTEASGGGLDLVAVNTVFATGSYIVLSLPDSLRRTPQQEANRAATTKDWKIYPTMPEQGQSLKLQGLQDGSYTLSFYNAAGICRNIPVRVEGGEAAVLPPSGSLASGMYWLQLSSSGKVLAGKANIFIR